MKKGEKFVKTFFLFFYFLYEKHLTSESLFGILKKKQKKVKNLRKHIDKNTKSFVYGVLYTVLGLLVSSGAFALIVYSPIAWGEEMKGLLLILVGLLLLMIGLIICVFSINHIYTISLYFKKDKEIKEIFPIEEIFSIENKGNSILEKKNENKIFKRRTRR